MTAPRRWPWFINYVTLLLAVLLGILALASAGCDELMNPSITSKRSGHFKVKDMTQPEIALWKHTVENEKGEELLLSCYLLIRDASWSPGATIVQNVRRETCEVSK